MLEKPQRHEDTKEHKGVKLCNCRLGAALCLRGVTPFKQPARIQDLGFRIRMKRAWILNPSPLALQMVIIVELDGRGRRFRIVELMDQDV